MATCITNLTCDYNCDSGTCGKTIVNCYSECVTYCQCQCDCDCNCDCKQPVNCPTFCFCDCDYNCNYDCDCVVNCSSKTCPVSVQCDCNCQCNCDCEPVDCRPKDCEYTCPVTYCDREITCPNTCIGKTCDATCPVTHCDCDCETTCQTNPATCIGKTCTCYDGPTECECSGSTCIGYCPTTCLSKTCSVTCNNDCSNDCPTQCDCQPVDCKQPVNCPSQCECPSQCDNSTYCVSTCGSTCPSACPTQCDDSIDPDNPKYCVAGPCHIVTCVDDPCYITTCAANCPTQCDCDVTCSKTCSTCSSNECTSNTCTSNPATCPTQCDCVCTNTCPANCPTDCTGQCAASDCGSQVTSNPTTPPKVISTPPIVDVDQCRQDQTVELEPNSAYLVEVAAGGGGSGSSPNGTGTAGGKWSGVVTTTTGGTATFGVGKGGPTGNDPAGGNGSFIVFPEGSSEEAVFVGGGAGYDFDAGWDGGGGYGGKTHSNGTVPCLDGNDLGQGAIPYNGHLDPSPSLSVRCDKAIGGSSSRKNSNTKGGYYLKKAGVVELNVGGGGAGSTGYPQPGRDGWVKIQKINSPPSATASITYSDSFDPRLPMVVSWGEAVDPDGDAVEYELEKSIDGTTWKVIYTGPETSFVDEKIITVNSLVYRVRAKDPSGATSEYTVGTMVYKSLPTAPEFITVPASVVFGMEFTVSWGEASDGIGEIKAYLLERKDGEEWTRVYYGPDLSFEDAILQEVSSTLYRVAAINQLDAPGEYKESSVIEVKEKRAPVAPTAIVAPPRAYFGDGIKISWEEAVDPDGDSVVYELEKRASGTWVGVYEGAENDYRDVVPYSVSSVEYRVRAKNSVGLYSDWAISNVVVASAVPVDSSRSQAANNRYFVEKCNHILGTEFKVPESKRVINVEWLLKAVNVVYPIIHVKGAGLKEPYNYHTQLLAVNLHSNQSLQVVDKNLVDDVLKYMIQFKGVCTCDMECYKGPYGVCTATCPNDTCNCNCNCKGACECPCQCQCECYEVRNGNVLVCPCNCEVASRNCYYPCECNCVCNCACPCPCPCDCPSDCQCIGPTCDKVTCDSNGKQKEIPKSQCETTGTCKPDGKPLECITYCQTTCAKLPDGKTCITGECGQNSNDATTCPYGNGNNGAEKGQTGSKGGGGNNNDHDCVCNCECNYDNACTACGGAVRNCLSFCGMPINCDVEYECVRN